MRLHARGPRRPAATLSAGVLTVVAACALRRAAGGLPLAPSEGEITASALDASTGHGYFGSIDPGSQIIVVVRVDLATMTRLGALAFQAGETGGSTAVLEPASQQAFFGTYSDPSYVVQIDVSGPAMTRVRRHNMTSAVR
jgi:hypothetical protein